jgi:hypothetical protein
MEGNIAQWSYWLGIGCLVIALLWRVCNAVGLWVPTDVTPGHSVWYMSSYKASLLFFVTTLTSAKYASLNSQMPQ